MAADPQPRSSEQPPTAAPKPSSFDHVALWVSQREALADLACRHLGMHEIERTDSFTLVGVDARLGKLTLFDAPGPRAAGALSRVALRVDDVEAALGRLPAALAVATAADGVPELAAPDGLPIGLVPTRGGQTSLVPAARIGSWGTWSLPARAWPAWWPPPRRVRSGPSRRSTRRATGRAARWRSPVA